jgi:hypothetical protein
VGDVKPSKRFLIALENIALQLRRRNDQVESFQREVLGVLEKITSESPSGAGATAQVVEPERTPCRVCGREGIPYGVCLEGELTQEQWDKHAEDTYDEHREYGAGKDTAWAKALEKTNERFGPRPAGPSQQEGEDR